MSVKRAQSEIDSHEFSSWMAYFQIEPFGEERADMRAGIISATFANCMGAKKGKKYKPLDFMPKYDRKAGDKTVYDMKAIWKKFVENHNASVKGKKG